MATRHTIVQHADGLHARPAELVAREAMRHQSSIAIVRDHHRIDAKSILDVLTLGAEQGVELTVEADGPDAEAAAEAVAQLIGSDFESVTNPSGSPPA